jgi:hypothetical protein
VVKQARAWVALAVVALGGFAVGAYGGGSGAALVQTTDTVTTPTDTLTVTESGPTTTRRQIIVTTRTATETKTVPPQVTTTPAESDDNTPWGWIAVGAGVLAALLIGLLLWHRHRANASEWGRETARFNRRCLVTLDEVLARGSVVTGQVEALAAEARSLESGAPDDPSRAAAANVRSRLEELARALEADRTLRFSTPPPNTEQVAYSTALIRQQVEELRSVLLPPEAGGASAWPTA